MTPRSEGMRLSLCALMVGAALPVVCASHQGAAQEVQVTAFDVPGAGTGAGQGTFVAGVNNLGMAGGYYIDANGVPHSFLRDRIGKITKFDPPGTTELPYSQFQGSAVLGLNDAGVAVGYFVDANFAVHAYIRAADGRFIAEDWPGECTASQTTGCHGSGAWNINNAGVVVGPYEDTGGNFVAHTAIRFPDGRVTTFEVPGSAMLAGEGTLPASFSGLNQSGAITGNYYDANYVFHAFLRTPEGSFIKFEAPGADAIDMFYGSFPTSLNDSSQIAGYYLDANGVYHGFERNGDGSFKTVDAPGADQTPGDFNGTFPQIINHFGSIAGYFSDAKGVNHAFVLRPDMSLATFNAPGADVVDPGAGTLAIGLNNAGVIAGFYYDSKLVAHGFLRVSDE